MAITLRLSDNTPAGKSSELTYDEMNDNLRSFYHSSSFAGTTLTLFTTGSVSHSISLASLQDDTNTNIYNTDGTLEGPRTVTLDTHDLTFDLSGGGNLVLNTLSAGDQASVLAYDSATGTVTRMSTGSLASVVTNLYNTNGTLTSARTVTANANNLTFSFADANFQVSSGGGTGGDIIFADLRQASTDSMMMINAGTGVVSWMSTSSLNVGGGGTPGGSNTQVQFNENGSFGGDANFTWNSGSNYLTLKGDISSPALRLVNAVPASSAGVTLGYISAYQDTLASADIGGIKVVSDGTFSNGDVPTRLEFLTTPDGTETPTVKLQIKNDGKLVAGEYGDGTFTGTAAYSLSVDSSGNIIETDAAIGVNLTQPSATTHNFNGDIGNSANYAWEVEVGSETSAPSGAGKMRVGHSSPGNRNTSIFTAISFHRTSSNATDASSVLDYLCENGTMAFRTTGGSLVADTLIIKEVDNSNANYVIVYVAITAGTNADIATSTTYRMDFQSDALIRLADQKYNRIVLNNLASSSPAAVLVPPTTAAVGDYYLVEVSAGSSNVGSFALNYPTYITGATTTYDIARTAVRYLAGTNTVTAISLDYSSYGQAAILHFRVHKVGGAAASFALIGADKVLS